MMNIPNMTTLMTLIVTMFVTCHAASDLATLVYSWARLDYDWPNVTARQHSVDNGFFVVENNIITGIKVYKNEVFVTVPRWRHGVPSTLNRVILKNGEAILQPFPSWETGREGDCRALQYVQSMEIDPNTGYMWIIDTGRINFMDTTLAQNLCPAKLVIYDINNNRQVHSYTFPNDVADPSSCFLNDIVLDYANSGHVRYAYVTDTRDAKLYVYDVDRDTSYFFQDPTMKAVMQGGVPIDGIAMSADFDFLYYCPIDQTELFQIPTSVLRDRHAQFSRHVRSVGTRRSRADGLSYGKRSLFYGRVDTNGVERWRIADDARDTSYGNVTLRSEVTVAHDDVRMKWVDTFAWDDDGFLWFTANDLQRYLTRTMDLSGAEGPNMFVWKVFVNESSYLSKANQHGSPHIVG